jgi:hypothetical protein
MKGEEGRGKKKKKSARYGTDGVPGKKHVWHGCIRQGAQRKEPEANRVVRRSDERTAKRYGERPFVLLIKTS